MGGTGPTTERGGVLRVLDGVAPALPTRILVVDDDVVILTLIEDAMCRLGYAVCATTDPREALVWHREANPAFDLVITDWSMPHLDGMEMVRAMRETGAPPLVLMITADSLGLAPAELRAAGIDRVLKKPFTCNALCALVQAALG